MRYALINTRKMMKEYIVISFFFNARGEDMGKSTIGTYRSLLLQFLERLSALQSVFHSLGLSTSSFNADHQWNVESSAQQCRNRATQLLETIHFIIALAKPATISRVAGELRLVQSSLHCTSSDSCCGLSNMRFCM